MLRKYQEKDHRRLIKMLMEEGATAKELESEDFNNNPTYILEKGNLIIGFFTYRVEGHGYPHLLHFLISKPNRNGRWAFRLIRLAKQHLRGERHKQFIIHAPKQRRDLLNIISWYARRLPYDESARHRFYLVEV